MGTRRCRMMSPVSISWRRKKVVTPVSLSPWMTAQLIGAAPRYCGSREACRLNVPKRGISQTTRGSMRKATTICKSARSSWSSSTKAESERRSGCSTRRPCAAAYCLTGDACSTLPCRPMGLSGIVTTPTTQYPPSTKALREATAKSGVPMNRILRFCLSISISFCE